MLKAYDYISDSPDRSLLQSGEHNLEELKLARAVVNKIGLRECTQIAKCVVCGCIKTKPLFEKWGIIYNRCPQCESVFAITDANSIEAYNNDADLMAFRKEDSYQAEAAERRDLIWDELLDWVSFRSFRYLGSNSGLVVTDFGDRYIGLINKIKASDLCISYSLKDSILEKNSGNIEKPDIVLSFDRIQKTLDPASLLAEMNEELKIGGLLFLSARTGTGFDILTLNSSAQIYPYEYVFLPSRYALSLLLQQAGFKLLDYSTPGKMDVGYVLNQYEHIDESNLFIRSLLKNSDKETLSEFQRFLQKSCMSSYAHIVARKEVGI